MCNVLRKPQKEQFCQNFNVSIGQKALEAAVVLELSESSFHLDGTVAAKQLSFFGGNILVRLQAHLLKFPADGDLLSLVLIFCLAAGRTVPSPFQTVLLHLVWRVLESVPSTITTTTESN